MMAAYAPHGLALTAIWQTFGSRQGGVSCIIIFIIISILITIIAITNLLLYAYTYYAQRFGNASGFGLPESQVTAQKWAGTTIN